MNKEPDFDAIRERQLNRYLDAQDLADAEYQSHLDNLESMYGECLQELSKYIMQLSVEYNYDYNQVWDDILEGIK